MDLKHRIYIDIFVFLVLKNVSCFVNLSMMFSEVKKTIFDCFFLLKTCC